ncbi:hypothetical protein [Polyangium sorediatum]|uniref:Uncharacterized protein n=1 Tax=Polyangium sorediatum TaxID=889274 RepID=A0ABT6NL78_9BACT|nr:hypothetical protein [Polyangium sorediatum]MDI1429028.1 hypothetical protein [Polyangium sorediatum]
MIVYSCLPALPHSGSIRTLKDGHAPELAMSRLARPNTLWNTLQRMHARPGGVQMVRGEGEAVGMLTVDTTRRTCSDDPRFLAVRHALDYVHDLVRTWPALGSDALRVVELLSEDMIAGRLDADAWAGIWSWLGTLVRTHGEGWAASGRQMLEEKALDARARRFALQRVVEGEAEAAAGWLARAIWGACAGGAGLELARQAIDPCVVELIEAEAAALVDEEDDGGAHARRRALHEALASRWAETALGRAAIRC